LIAARYRIAGAAATWFAALAALVQLGGCAGVNIQSSLQQTLVQGDCAAAQALIEKSHSQYGSNAELLYLLDGAMVSFECHDYPQAQQQLHAADELAENLWTESISRQAVSMVTSEYSIKYAGEDYERVMIHIVSAIGYLLTGELDEALVEVRRLDSLLNRYAAEYKKDQFYKIDAFARYLSGMLREADAELDGAFIDYLKAAEAYQNQLGIYGVDLPDMLARDLWRLASQVGRRDDAQRLIAEPPDPLAPDSDADPQTGKLVLVVFDGQGPRKVQDTIIVPSPQGPISVAFPRVAPGSEPCLGGRLQLRGAGSDLESQVALVSNIHAIATQSLAEKKGRIVAKTLARAVAKQMLIHGIASSQNNAADQRAVSSLLNLLNILVLERADLRSWRTLPGHIMMTRMFVKPGTYSGQVLWCLNQRFELGDLTLAAGETRFLFLDTRYAGPS